MLSDARGGQSDPHQSVTPVMNQLENARHRQNMMRNSKLREALDALSNQDPREGYHDASDRDDMNASFGNHQDRARRRDSYYRFGFDRGPRDSFESLGRQHSGIMRQASAGRDGEGEINNQGQPI